jgi:hypothetical protein
MRGKVSIVLPLLFMASTVRAESSWIKDWPATRVQLLESSVIPEKDLQFSSEAKDGYLLFQSNLSPQWRKGVYVHFKTGHMTIPGVGTAPVEASAQGYLWHSRSHEANFSKEGIVRITRLPQGCELTWEFRVVARGDRLVNETGRLGYHCSAGPHPAWVSQDIFDSGLVGVVEKGVRRTP